jgi:hypothetical protein
LLLLPTSPLSFLRQYQRYPFLAIHLQRRLTKVLTKALFEKLLRDAPTLADKSRMLSYRQPGACRVLNLTPKDKSFELFPSYFRHIIRIQLGLLPAAWLYFSSHSKLKCPMCHKVDLVQVPTHALHCDMVRRVERTSQHDCVANALQYCSKRNKVPTMWCPGLADSNKQTDVGFQFPSGKFVQTDITIVSEDAPSNARGQAMKAAIDERKIKERKYKAAVQGEGAIFKALVFSTAGGWLEEFPILTKRIAAAGLVNRAYNPLSAKDIRDMVALEIQKGNALCSIKLLNRLRSFAPHWKQRLAGGQGKGGKGYG